MVDLIITLPPPAQSSAQKWETYLNTPSPMTAELVASRMGSVPRYQPVVFIRNLETPHPNHKDYTMIETMKREQVAAQARANRAIISRIISMRPQERGWAPPILTAGTPRMKDFARALNLKMPVYR